MNMLANNFNIGDKFTYGDYGLITVIEMQGDKWFKSEDGHIFAYIKEDSLILYKFVYSTWDEYYSFELYSNEKYSKEELQKIQDNIFKQILKEQKANFEKTEKFNEGYGNFLYFEGDIVKRIKDILIKQYDFIEINYDNILYTNMDDWYKKYIELKDPKIKALEEK